MSAALLQGIGIGFEDLNESQLRRSLYLTSPGFSIFLLTFIDPKCQKIDNGRW